MKYFKKNVSLILKIIALGLCVSLFCCTDVYTKNTNVYAENSKSTAKNEKLDLFAKHAVLLDGASERVLYGKDEQSPVPMASTTKIMTCIIALEYADLDFMCETSVYAASMPEVRLGATKKEHFKLKDLLYALMLKSYNDCAVIIAENVAQAYLQTNPTEFPAEAGNLANRHINELTKEDSKTLVHVFATLMNKKAESLGCKNTYFITPNGLDAKDENGIHSTTARDLAVIMSYCIQNSEFLDITQAPSHSFCSYNEDLSILRSHAVSNANAFLSMYDNIISGKTGFTCDAGYCYVCAYKDDNRTFIVALLACGWPNNKTYKWKDAKKLLDYGRSSYNMQTIYDKNSALEPLSVWDGLKYNELIPYADLNEDIQLLLSDKDSVHVTVNYNDVELPIYKNETIGSIHIFINDTIWKEIDIKADRDIKKLKFIDYFYKLFNAFGLSTTK